MDKANITGNQLEETVKNVLKGKGFRIIKYKDWSKNDELFGTELLLENAPYTTIYGHKGATEFLLISREKNMEIRIECKWQQVAGSVDEKLPYLYLNCIEAMPEKTIIILIDGKGWKPGSIQWLREAVSHKKYQDSILDEKIIKVFTLTDFMTWANNNF